MTARALESVSNTRILMLAPEPVFRPRGTPLSIVARLRALAALGCRVDLVTYPFGETVKVDGVTEIRSSRFPVRREPPIGPSPAKAALDLHLARLAWRLAARNQHDLVWTHEEAAFLGAWLARRRHLPHLYDMHSSLPEQMVNYGWFRPRGPALRLAYRAERWLLRHSDAVIAVCPALAEHAHAVRPDLPVIVIENPPLGYALALESASQARPVPGRILYAGNLARNQGILLLLKALGRVRERLPVAHLVLLGGGRDEVLRAQTAARRLGLADGVEFRGACSPAEMIAAHQRAVVLVSPRTAGTNVPSKVYTYLAAGRPIVATDIRAHTQLLDDTCAILVPPTPEGLSDGIIRGLVDRRLAERLAAAGRERLAERFTPAAYVEGVRHALLLALSRPAQSHLVGRQEAVVESVCSWPPGRPGAEDTRCAPW